MKPVHLLLGSLVVAMTIGCERYPPLPPGLGVVWEYPSCIYDVGTNDIYVPQTDDYRLESYDVRSGVVFGHLEPVQNHAGSRYFILSMTRSGTYVCREFSSRSEWLGALQQRGIRPDK